MVEVKNLSKRYGNKSAVNDISFTAGDSEILGLLGPNGAGKSTTMNILTGYISSTDGQVMINGIDILEEPIKAKKEIGYLPETPPLYPDMTVKEYLHFIYDLKKCRLPRNTHLADICSLTKIEEVYDRLIKNLSKGYQQRVGLAQALVGDPKVLILDEPTAGLDPKQIIDIRTLIKKLGKNHTVILSTHILSEAQQVCDRIVVIDKGNIVADDTEQNLSRSLSQEHRLLAQIDGPEKEVIEAIMAIRGVKSIERLKNESGSVNDYLIETNGKTDVRREIFGKVASSGWCLLGLKAQELSLEDIFLRLTMGETVKGFKSKKEEK